MAKEVMNYKEIDLTKVREYNDEDPVEFRRVKDFLEGEKSLISMKIKTKMGIII